MLKAGGGQVLRKAPPYSSCLPQPQAATNGGKGRKGRAAATAAAGTQDVANLAVIGGDKTTQDRCVSGRETSCYRVAGGGITPGPLALNN
jgi:hypothetical protein